MRTNTALRAPFVALSLGLVLAAGCTSDEFEPGVPASLTLSDSQVTLTSVGQNRLLIATVKNQHDDPIEASLTWSTSDPLIVLVNGDGLMSATGVGTAVVTVSTSGLTDTATVEVAQTPAHIVQLLGYGQSGPPSQALPSPLTVRVTDALNHPIAGVEVTFEAPDGASVDPASAVTDFFGQASTTLTLGAATGSYTAIATVTGTALNTTFSASTGGPFSIEVVFVGDQPTPAQVQAFMDAKARWESIIQADLPDDYAILPAGSCGNSPDLDRPIDDLVIFASVGFIDGPGGVLGQAGPCFLHSVGGLPAIGQMTFDADDLNDLEANGILSPVILHEMGHVLGYGTLWDGLGFLADGVLTGGTDPHFTGTGAIAAFDAAGGAAYPNGKVPVEDQGGPGTADAHWRESVFDNEVMTGYINLGANPLSAISIASLGDLGYTVDSSQADPYTVVNALRASGANRVVLHLQNDVRVGRIGVLGRNGRVSRWVR
jgi:hypothetical protein